MFARKMHAELEEVYVKICSAYSKVSDCCNKNNETRNFLLLFSGLLLNDPGESFLRVQWRSLCHSSLYLHFLLTLGGKLFSRPLNYFLLKATFDTRKDKKSLIFVIHSPAAIRFSVGKAVAAMISF